MESLAKKISDKLSPGGGTQRPDLLYFHTPKTQEPRYKNLKGQPPPGRGGIMGKKVNLARVLSKRKLDKAPVIYNLIPRANVIQTPDVGRGQALEVDYYGDAEAYRRRLHLAPLRRFGRYRMPVSNKIRFEVFKRDGFTCQYCGRKTPEVVLEVDHIVPVKENGTDDIQNLVTSCFECNRGKAGTPLQQVFTRKDLKEDLLFLAEQELQLKEYNKLVEEKKLREQAGLDLINAKFQEIWKKEHLVLSDDCQRGMRQFLRLFHVEKILEAVELAGCRMARKYPRRNQAFRNAVVNYAFGVLHHWRRETSDAKPHN